MSKQFIVFNSVEIIHPFLKVVILKTEPLKVEIDDKFIRTVNGFSIRYTTQEEKEVESGTGGESKVAS